MGKQILYNWPNLASMLGGSSGVLLTSQLKCHLVSWEAAALPLVMPWNYPGSCDPPRGTHPANLQCRGLSLHRSAAIRQSQAKKKEKKKSTILTVTIPFKVLHHLLPSHFEHSFSEDLIHVHVNAASDQSPSVTQGTAGSREIVNKEVVQEIRRALNPAFRNSLHFHLRHICLFLMITIFWSALPRACRAGEKQIDRELSPLEKNSHFRDNVVV